MSGVRSGGGKGLIYAEGMTSTSNERIIYLDDILGEDGVEAIEHKDGMSFPFLESLNVLMNRF